MAIQSDVKLNNNVLTLEGNYIETNAHDFKMDNPDRRRSTAGHRRALVHGFNDELVINFNGDYPGGVVINGTVQVPNRLVSGGSLEGKTLTLGEKGNDADLYLKDREGTTRVRLSTDGFNSKPWPAWPGGNSPSSIDLLSEIRLLKEEVLSLRQELNKLKR